MSFREWLCREEQWYQSVPQDQKTEMIRTLSQWVEQKLTNAIRKYWSNPSDNVMDTFAQILGAEHGTEPGGQEALVLYLPSTMPQGIAGKPLYLTNHGGDQNATSTNQEDGVMQYMRLDLGRPENANTPKDRQKVLDRVVMASHEAVHVFQRPRTDAQKRSYQQAINQKDSINYRLDQNEIEAHAHQFAHLWILKNPGLPYRLVGGRADIETVNRMASIAKAAGGNSANAGRDYFGTLRKPEYGQHMALLDGMISKEVKRRAGSAQPHQANTSSV